MKTDKQGIKLENESALGVPPDLPPRFLVSAASYALATGQIPARQLSNRVINHLTSPIPPSSPSFKEIQAALL